MVKSRSCRSGPPARLPSPAVAAADDMADEGTPGPITVGITKLGCSEKEMAEGVLRYVQAGVPEDADAQWQAGRAGSQRTDAGGAACVVSFGCHLCVAGKANLAEARAAVQDDSWAGGHGASARWQTKRRWNTGAYKLTVMVSLRAREGTSDLPSCL
jgi:hypothetical protein